jgi:transcriptional regulator with XRE-family HTH domain
MPVCRNVKLIAQYLIQGKGLSIMDEAHLRALLSQNIKKYRQRKGWSQAKLAEKMEISTNYLSDIETKRGWLSPFSLVKLANALEIEVYMLFQPKETISDDVLSTVNKCLDDFSESLRVSFDKAIVDSLAKIQKTI